MVVNMNKRMIDADALLRWVKATKGLFDDETLDDFYSSTLNKINELATPALEPQESIFDADGWCWDLSLINNDDEYHFLIESHRGGVGHKVTDKKSYYQLIGLTWFIDENLKENECLGDKIIAWKPIANLPKEKS